MSFFGSPQKTSGKTPVLIFDIGGTSVGAALALLSSGSKPYVVHASREWLRPLEEVSLARLTGLLETAIDSVAEELLSVGAHRLHALGYGRRLPNAVDCFMTAPWYVPHMGTVHLAGAKPFKVTHGMLEHAIDGERKSIEKRFGASPVKGGSALAIIEQQILSLAVNGYTTENPYVQSANDVEFLLYTALAEEGPLASFSARIARTFHVEKATTHSFLLAFFSAIRDSREAEEDFLLLDVSGEVTEVSVVRNGGLRASVSFPLGRNFLARSLASECNLSFEEALSLLAVHSLKQSNDTVAARFSSALLRVEEKWMRQFEESLARIAMESFLPHSIFIAADEKIAQWISAVVRNEALYQYTLTAEPFVVNLAEGKTFDAHVACGPGVPKDPFLMVDAMFLSKLKM